MKMAAANTIPNFPATLFIAGLPDYKELKRITLDRNGTRYNNTYQDKDLNLYFLVETTPFMVQHVSADDVFSEPVFAKTAAQVAYDLTSAIEGPRIQHIKRMVDITSATPETLAAEYKSLLMELRAGRWGEFGNIDNMIRYMRVVSSLGMYQHTEAFPRALEFYNIDMGDII